MSQHDNYELTDEGERGLLRFLAGAETISQVLASSGPDWLIEGWVASSATMVAGSPECGKSTLVAGMAAAVANGETWLDVPVTTDRTGPVVIVATDPSDGGQWVNKGRDLKVGRSVSVAVSLHACPGSWAGGPMKSQPYAKTTPAIVTRTHYSAPRR